MITDLESSFMAKNRELAADIWSKVLNYREKITPNTPHSLRSCLGYLHDVAGMLDSRKKTTKLKLYMTNSYHVFGLVTRPHQQHDLESFRFWISG